MFQTFLRARAQTYLRSIIGDRDFRARSPERDAETDRERLYFVLVALDEALYGAESEQAGLMRRVDDVVARASVTFGNGNDEYLTRETLDSKHLDLLEAEIQNGQRRLRELAVSIGHYRFLKSDALSRFPDYEPRKPVTS
ncbi:MAG: hypothetical protein ABWY18_17230 [Tardiphaga sp.]